MTLKEHGNTYNLVRTSPLYLCGGVESPATPLVGGDVESPATPLAGGEVESPATPLVDSEVESPATPLADDEVESPTTPLVSGDVESPATPLAVERWSHLPHPLLHCVVFPQFTEESVFVWNKHLIQLALAQHSILHCFGF